MLTRQLGELKVSAIGLGCMSLAAYYEAGHDKALAIATIQTAYQAGVSFFDTADMYANSEAILGQALQDVFATARDSVVIATKVGFVSGSDGQFYLDLSPEHIKAGCQDSLQKLGLAYIDLYYLHRLPVSPKELEASLDAMIELLKQGKIRSMGVSEASSKEVRFIHHYLKERGLAHKFAAVQTEFSLFTQDALHSGVIAACRELGIGFVPYSPLSRALLAPASKININTQLDANDFRTLLPRFQGNNLKANLSLRDQLAALAEGKGCSLPQLALAWILAQGDFIVPIPGTRKIKNMLDNLGAVAVQLTPGDLAKINDIVGKGVQGARYTEDMLKGQNIK